ncbi:MAG: fimbrial chaperone protein [Planctomycetota bacterium]|jgi:fimbrial chaperone protein
MIKYLLNAIAVLAFVSAIPSYSRAAGNLMVTPTRVVFEERTRSAQVTLVNQGTETGNFRISFIRQNMTENGEFEAVSESEAGLFSDPMIRYSPRQVSLPPGQSQVIRLQLRRPNALDDGEYRSHMLFQALPSPSSTSIEKAAAGSSEGITIELIPIVGVSIPVIVRQGELVSAVALANAKIIPAANESANTRISIEISRQGGSSVYGDFRVSFTPDGGAPVVVAQANGVSVYANINKRRFEMPLNFPAGVNLLNGVLDIAFINSGSDIETGTLARTRLELN